MQRVAVEGGGRRPYGGLMVRREPSLGLLKIGPPDDRLKSVRAHLVGYVCVIGRQEGIDYLLRAIQQDPKNVLKALAA